MKKKLVRIDCSSAGILEAKPPKDQRPKCLQCDKTIVMRRTYWYESSLPWKERPQRFVYDGISYFCSRNCCMAYAHSKAQEELNVPKFNNV